MVPVVPSWTGRATVLVLATLLSVHSIAATKTWTGGASDSLWNSPANWSGGTVPGSGDDVVLDNSSKSGSYLASISTGVKANCRTLTVGYAGNPNVITLRISGYSSEVPALTIAGNSGTGIDDFVVSRGGVFENLSGVASASTVLLNSSAGNTARVKDGGTIVHNTLASFVGSFPASGAGATTFEAGSTMEFGQKSATGSQYAINGRTYGNLSFSGGDFAAGTGSSGLTIHGDLLVKAGASLTLVAQTGTVSVGGDITNNGTATLDMGGAPGVGVVFNGNSVIHPPGASQFVRFNEGCTVNSGAVLTVGSDKVNAYAGKHWRVNGTIAFNANGTASDSNGAYQVQINSGATLCTDKGNLDLCLAANQSFVINSNADLLLNGTTLQSGGTAQPTVIRNLTINNSGGGFRLSANLTVNGSLTDADGVIDTNAFLLTLNGNSTNIPATGGLHVSSGGTLLLPAGKALAIEAVPTIDGTANINGQLTLSATGSRSANLNGTLNINSGATLSCSPTGIGDDDAGTVNINSGSTIRIRNAAGISPLGVPSGQFILSGGQNYSPNANYIYEAGANQNTGSGLPPSVASLTINNPGFTVTLNNGSVTAGTLAVIAGTFSTGTGTVAVTSDATVNGALLVSNGGTLQCSATPLTGSGSFTVNAGGTLAIKHPSGISSNGSTGQVQTITRSFSPASSYTFNGSSTQTTGLGLTGASTLRVANPSGVTLSSGIAIGALHIQSGTLLVPAGVALDSHEAIIDGSLDVAGSLLCTNPSGVFTGTGIVLVQNAAYLRLTHPNGIDGQFITNGPNTFSTGATYAFSNPNEAQATGASLPTTVATLVIDNPTTVTLSGPVQATSEMRLAKGTLQTGGFTATVGSSPVSTGLITGSGKVDGILKRYVSNSPASYPFPLVKGGMCRATLVDFSAAAPAVGGSITASFTALDPGDWGLPLADGTHELVNVARDGFWTLTTDDGLAGGAYNLSLDAQGFGGLGNVDTLRIVKRISSESPWTLHGTQGTSAGTVICRHGLADFSDFGIAGPVGQVPVVLSAFGAE